MRIYIAGPFFNAPQRTIIERIHTICLSTGIDFYSPCLHSGSHTIAPNERKNYSVWEPVLRSNIAELYKCDMVVAVLEYAMPMGMALYPATEQDFIDPPMPASLDHIPKPVELPDVGTVWECGAAFILQKPTYGFRTKPQTKRNLMLSHTVAGNIFGYKNLRDFLEDVAGHSIAPESHRLAPRFDGEVE